MFMFPSAIYSTNKRIIPAIYVWFSVPQWCDFGSRIVIFGHHDDDEYRPSLPLGATLPIEYPLVTHDPNMLKNKSRGNLVGKIKVSLPEGKYENFR